MNAQIIKETGVDVLTTAKGLIEYYDTFGPHGDVLEHWARLAREDLGRLYDEVVEHRYKINQNRFRSIIEWFMKGIGR